MIKKVLTFFLSIVMFALIFVPKANNLIVASDPCDEDPNSGACRIQTAKESQKKIDEYNNQINEAKANIETAQKLAVEYYNLAIETGKEITAIENDIVILQASIDALTVKIEENEKRVETLNNRVLSNMESAQGTMHFNPLLDFILGASGFADMLRRTYGVEAIMSKESSDRSELIETIKILEEDKAKVVVEKETLDTQRLKLESKEKEYMVLFDYYVEMENQAQDLIDELNNSIEEEKVNYREALNFLDDVSVLDVASSFSKTFADTTYFISGPFPRYYNGNIHLGVDYAINYGSAIYAPANALVVTAYQGCSGYGYWGCTCGGDGYGNGASGGGNQVGILTSVDNHVFVIWFCHLSQINVERYQVVLTGDILGWGGSSGNSSGPHCHVEMFYLGDGDWTDIQEDYLMRSYSSSYNCGWGSYAYYYTRCDITGGTAPCRLDAREWLYEK